MGNSTQIQNHKQTWLLDGQGSSSYTRGTTAPRGALKARPSSLYFHISEGKTARSQLAERRVCSCVLRVSACIHTSPRRAAQGAGCQRDQGNPSQLCARLQDQQVCAHRWNRTIGPMVLHIHMSGSGETGVQELITEQTEHSSWEDPRPATVHILTILSSVLTERKTSFVCSHTSAALYGCLHTDARPEHTHSCQEQCSQDGPWVLEPRFLPRWLDLGTSPPAAACHQE